MGKTLMADHNQILHMSLDTHDVNETEDDIKEGLVSADFLRNQKWYELEKERIFGKCWILLGHVTEIPDAGDYVVRHILDDSLILTKTEDGDIKVLLNTCRHQGMQVCRTEEGNTSHFRCPYHGWTYNNAGDLIGVPHQDEAYDDLEPERFALDEIESGIYDGLIFGSLDPEESLEDYLGDFKWYLDFYMDRSPSGMEVRGPQRRIVKSNWKVPMVNQLGDSYHGTTTHFSARKIGALKRDQHTKMEAKASDGHQTFAGMGGLNIRPNNVFDIAPEEVQNLHQESLDRKQLELLEKSGPPGPGGLIPNAGFSNNVGMPEPDLRVPFTYLRALRPLDAQTVEALTWFVVEKDAPETYKENSYQAFLLNFGTSGIVRQDDVEIWTKITDAIQGERAQKLDLNYEIGLGEDPIEDWEFPGIAYETQLLEANARYFWKWYRSQVSDSQQRGEN